MWTYLSSYTLPKSHSPLALVSSAKREDVFIHLSKAASPLCILDFFCSHPFLVFYLLVCSFFSCFINLFLSAESSPSPHKHDLMFLTFWTSHSIVFPMAPFFLLLYQQNVFKIIATRCLCLFSHHSLFGLLHSEFSFHHYPLKLFFWITSGYFRLNLKFTVVFDSLYLSLPFGYWDIIHFWFSCFTLAPPPQLLGRLSSSILPPKVRVY